MQVSPLLTPLNFNTRKRARSVEGYEAHYFKKRLISCLSSIMQDISSFNHSHMNTDDISIDKEDDVKTNEKEEFEVNNTASSRIKNISINGSILPMEQRSGESQCRIPLFVLNDNLHNNHDLPLVLYQKNDWSSITELEEDDSSIASNDPMDLD